MLKITESSDLAPKELQANENEVVGGSGNDRNLFKFKKSKNTKSWIQTYNKAMGEPIFLNPGAQEAFNQLKQVFTKALILPHFDLECHIWIEINISNYAISRVLSYLTSNQVTLDSESNLTKFEFGQ